MLSQGCITELATDKAASQCNTIVAGALKHVSLHRSMLRSQESALVAFVCPFSQLTRATANAVNAILAAPKTITPPVVDYLAKEDYGKVPAYLSHVKVRGTHSNTNASFCVGAMAFSYGSQ